MGKINFQFEDSGANEIKYESLEYSTESLQIINFPPAVSFYYIVDL